MPSSRWLKLVYTLICPQEQDDFSSNHHPALVPCPRMSFFAKPVPTFAGHALAAVAILFSLTSPASASINQAGALMPPAATLSKSCSGAFRYAARAGNDDIVEVSPVQAFAKNRRLSRMRYAGRGMSDAEPVVSRLIVLTAMCGAR